MANLNGQNIGTNYKGFLNLDSTINTPLDGTLRAVTDGMGTSSPLQISTDAVTLGSGTITSNGLLTIKGSGGNILSLRNSSNVEMLSVSNLGLLQLGGTTSSFPAIKRNGAAIDFRLANDSNYCGVSSLQVTIGAGEAYNFLNTQDQIKHYNGNSIAFKLSGAWCGRITTSGTVFGSDTINASAALEAVSTTKGFLMPRQTTAQINAISTPAAGLQVYNTDLAQPCFYDGAAWRKVSHTTM